MRGARARHEVRALEVDAHHGVVASHVRLGDGEGPVRGGVVDDDVHAPEPIDGGGDGGRHLVFVRDVGLDGDGVASGGDARGGGVLNRAGERRVVLGGLREYHHVRAAARATHGDGLAYASRRARDHDGAALHREGEVRGGGLVAVQRQGVDVVLVQNVAKPRETRLREGREEVALGASQRLRDVELRHGRRGVAPGALVQLETLERGGAHASRRARYACEPRRRTHRASRRGATSVFPRLGTRAVHVYADGTTDASPIGTLGRTDAPEDSPSVTGTRRG